MGHCKRREATPGMLFSAWGRSPSVMLDSMRYLSLYEAHIVVTVLTIVGMGDIPLRLVFSQDCLVDIVIVCRLRERYFDKVLFESFTLRLRLRNGRGHINSHLQQGRISKHIRDLIKEPFHGAPPIILLLMFIM